MSSEAVGLETVGEALEEERVEQQRIHDGLAVPGR